MLVYAATGHRPEKLGNEYSYKGPYSDFIKRKMIARLTEQRPDKVISGMAIGVDQIWALVALELDIPVIAAIPFKGQEKRWPKNSQRKYREILSHKLVTQHILTEEGYSPKAMHERNMWMVNRCDELVAVWNGDTKGGTAHTVNYAKSVDKPIFRIDPDGWRPLTFVI